MWVVWYGFLYVIILLLIMGLLEIFFVHSRYQSFFCLHIELCLGFLPGTSQHDWITYWCGEGSIDRILFFSLNYRRLQPNEGWLLYWLYLWLSLRIPSVENIPETKYISSIKVWIDFLFLNHYFFPYLSTISFTDQSLLWPNHILTWFGYIWNQILSILLDCEYKLI